MDGLNGPFTCFLRAVFQNSEVLFVFVFNAVFQDAQNYQRCFFFLHAIYVICIFKTFCSWNEIIHILSSTSLLTENKGTLVSKCRVQRSIFLFFCTIIINLYLLIWNTYIRYLARLHLLWCLVSAWDTCWVLDQPLFCI